MSAFQKITVVSCVCVCVALLLPKLLLPGGGGGDPASAEGAHFQPVMQRKSAPAPLRGGGGNSAHPPEAIARAKGATATVGKSNLAGQIIPVYGFGILLYIVYIIFKITSGGKTMKSRDSRFSTASSENMKRKITDFELTQLQERLKETEEVMERIVSRSETQSRNTPRKECVSVDQEEKLLLQLREITRVMQEGGLVETPKPECDQGFTDDPEEMLKHWSSSCCTTHHQTNGEETERADRRVEDEETERADRRVEDEETERADRRVEGEETERADRRVEGEETERADRRVEEEGDAGGGELVKMEQSEDQHRNLPLPGFREIRRRNRRGTESSH